MDWHGFLMTMFWFPEGRLWWELKSEGSVDGTQRWAWGTWGVGTTAWKCIYHSSVAPSLLGRAVWRNCWGGTTAARRLTCQKCLTCWTSRVRTGSGRAGTSDSPCLAAKIIQDLYDIYVRTGLWLIMDQFWRINYIKIWSICPSMMFSLNQVVVVWRRGPWGIIESD